MASEEPYRFDIEKFEEKFKKEEIWRGENFGQRSAFETEDFSETRLCLLKMYHSNIQTHAGYLIGIIIGSLTLFSRMDTFFSTPPVFPHADWLFWLLLYSISIALIWVVFRILYWTNYASHALGITAREVLEKFNLLNTKNVARGKGYSKNVIPPLTIAFQTAIDEIHEGIDRTKQGRLTRIAVSTAKNPLGFLLLAIIGFLMIIIIGFAHFWVKVSDSFTLSLSLCIYIWWASKQTDKHTYIYART